MSEPARLVDTPATRAYRDELLACAKIASELEQAVREYQHGHPIAARMHLLEVVGQSRALVTGEMA